MFLTTETTLLVIKINSIHVKTMKIPFFLHVFSLWFLKPYLKYLILFDCEIVALSGPTESTITVLPSHVLFPLSIVAPRKVTERLAVIVAFIGNSQVIIPAKQRSPLTIASDQVPVFLRQHLLELIQLKQKCFPFRMAYVLTIFD